MRTRITALITAIAASVSAVSFTAITSSAVENIINAADTVRVAEQLDRGLTAMMTDEGVYLTWRMHADEDAVYGTSKTNVTYDIYCDGEPIAYDVDATNYIDAYGTADSQYRVVKSRADMNECKPVKPFASGSNYFDISVNRPEAITLPRIASLKASNGKNYNYFVTDAAPDDTSGLSADKVDYVVNSWRDENVGHKTYDYTINDCSCGDVDGDGEYEIIVKWDCNGQDNSFSGLTGPVYIDAYEMTGERLWRINLGENIRAGAHYTQFLVYDFDGDGKAEITAKTAPGSKDSGGAYVSTKSHVAEIKALTASDNETNGAYIDNNGYILKGDEFLTIFNGETGAAIDTIYYPNQRVDVSVWGDTFGNRLDRFTADVAYLDGEKPYAVYMRGYYFGRNGQQRQAACGVAFDGEKLECKYSFDTYNVNNYKSKNTSSSYFSDGTYKGVDGYVSGNEIYVGEGNHNCTVADVDNDGKDEVLTGALCYEVKDNNTLGVKWCTFLQHGDALHIGDYDPTHEGYEFFTVHEDSGTNSLSGKDVTMDYGMSVIDPATGDILYHKSNTKDTGRGVMANTGAGGYYQFSGSADMACYGNGDFRAISDGTGSNFRIFWDGDLYDNLLNGTSVEDWNGSRMEGIFNADGCVSVNGTKANPALQADLFGDWREEIVYPTSDNTKLRVYTTDIYTQYKMKSLMYDSVYRSGVAAEQTAYNQPPHIGYYLDIENTPHTTPAPSETANAETLYEKGTNADTVWVEADKSAWTLDGTANVKYISTGGEGYGILSASQANPGSFSLSKSFELKENSTVTYDLSWAFGGVYNYDSGSAGTANANYTYVQIGDNIRFAWHGGPSCYLLYYSTDGGVTYTNTGIAGSNNRSGNCKISAVFNTATNKLVSLTANNKKLAENFSMTTPETVSFGFLRGSVRLFSNNVQISSMLNSIKVTQAENKPLIRPALTPRPALPDTSPTPEVTQKPSPSASPVVTQKPTPVPATLPPTGQPTTCSPIPSVTPSATHTTAPIVTATPTPSATPTDEAGYIVDYNFEHKYATIHCGVDRENSLVLFASYEDGKLVSIKTVPMQMQKGVDRKPQARDFENGETVKIFVWDTIENQEPIMEAKEFSR